MSSVKRPAALAVLALAALAGGLAVPSAAAQSEARSLYNQDRLAELLYGRRDSLEALPAVTYRTYRMAHPSGNSILARHDLYAHAGNGDIDAGRRSLEMVAFLNRVFVDELAHGDSLVIPSHLDLDPRAYSPFPHDYPGGRAFGKLFVIDKSVQAWAAYERGRLARWGLVSTGADGSETPNGRFNFNWKELHRVSTLSPPGVNWDMRWVFNFHDARGIHIHQYYALPTTGAASHGCVRLMTADAQWIYGWADGWVTTAGAADRGFASRGGRVVQQGTTVLVVGRQPAGTPERFRHTPAGPELITVSLPANPYAVPAGTPQQVEFDRRRAAQAPTRPAAARSRAS